MRSFILGTDWWTDCDDAVALRVLARHVKRGEGRLLGVVINACMKYSVPSLLGFLRSEGLTDIPVGLDTDATDFGGAPPYQERLAKSLCPGVTNDAAEAPVRLYRRLLASAEGKVELIEIGYLQTLVALLKSPPDDISDLSGMDLVRERVSKAWVMAGKWDKDGEKENNFCRNDRSRVAGRDFCALCPVPVTFLGWETGYGVLSGGHLKGDDPLHLALLDHGSEKGRHSWDPMLVLLALIGEEKKGGYTTVTGTASVDADTGANHFAVDPCGRHCYCIKMWENAVYASMINDLL